MKKKNRKKNIPGLYRDQGSIKVGRLDFHVLEDGTEVYYLKLAPDSTCSFYYRPRDGKFYVGISRFTDEIIGSQTRTNSPRLLKVLSLSGRMSDKPVIILNYPAMSVNGYKNITYKPDKILLALGAILMKSNIQFFELVVKTLFELKMNGGDYCLFRSRSDGFYLSERSTLYYYFTGSPSQYLIDLNRNTKDIVIFNDPFVSINSPLHFLVKCTSIRDASKAIFGVSSKLAVNSLTTATNAGVLQIIYCLKGLVPWDHIIPYLPFLNYNKCVSYVINYAFRRLLKLLPMKLRLQFLALADGKNPASVSCHTIFDSCRMYSELYKEKRARAYLQNIEEYTSSWDELHEFLSRANSAYHQEKNAKQFRVKLTVSDRFRHYYPSFPSVDGWSVRLPDTFGDVYSWGTDMHHCIYSYAEQHAMHICVLLGVYQGDTLMYNIMLNPSGDASGYTCRQFYGKYNCQPTEEHRQIVSLMLGFSV